MNAKNLKSDPPPDAVFVLGMHRSGTSATAGALRMLGLQLGDTLLEPAADNPKGYFEHAEAVSINDGLLEALDRAWNDIRALPAGWAEGQAAKVAEQLIVDQVFATFATGKPWALKDPRLCRLLPTWLRALSRQDLRAACVLVIRHPSEVAGSLATRDFMPHAASHILWLRHVLESVQASEHLPRALLRYDSLLAKPGPTLQAAGRQIGLEWAVDAKSLKAFVSSDDRHHEAQAGVPPESEWHALALEVYSALCGRDPWAAVQPLVLDFEQLVGRESSLIEFLGRTLKGAHAANQAWAAKSTEAQAQADDLQRGLDRVTELSLQRLEELEALREQTDATQRALQRAEQDALSARRDLEQMGRQLAVTQQAQQVAERMSLERLEQMTAFDQQMRVSQVAYADLELIASNRLVELEQTSRQLAETQRAQVLAEQLAVERLEQLATAEKQAQAYEAALESIEALAISRLAEMESMGGELGRTQEALAFVERLAVTRLATVAEQSAHLQEVQSTLSALVTELEQRKVRLDQLERSLATSETENTGLRRANELASASLRATEQIVVSLREGLQAADAAVVAQREQIDALTAGLAQAVSTGRDWQLRADASESRALALQDELHHITQRLLAAENSLDAIWASWRWRLAHPLQWRRKRRELAQ